MILRGKEAMQFVESKGLIKNNNWYSNYLKFGQSKKYDLRKLKLFTKGKFIVIKYDNEIIYFEHKKLDEHYSWGWAVCDYRFKEYVQEVERKLKEVKLLKEHNRKNFSLFIRKFNEIMETNQSENKKNYKFYLKNYAGKIVFFDSVKSEITTLDRYNKNNNQNYFKYDIYLARDVMIRDLRTTNIIEIMDLNPETNYIFLDGLNIGTIEHFLKGDYYIV